MQAISNGLRALIVETSIEEVQNIVNQSIPSLSNTKDGVG